ncbi:hypothetical protein [Streptosporangium roseum]|uniref:Uncharacterized protein n=1 Tax=Streptosporangium roseum (strain ATCC 12428 / DSM 43021 / JCM 3005 / KCTC 9067 / NCIMB 10171 / NRRL 2505 / NI 9100) TaxID=479432 RepID=D2B471_STRRD|nr:hypothetical protein [Streptosporangium roseum]ACZ91305.1 hypothetical protein Sros_8663 [Streptosporangium roseum DSM 43021]
MVSDPPDEQVTSVAIPPKRWRCCHCGGTGVGSYGDTCEHCDGLGFC